MADISVAAFGTTVQPIGTTQFSSAAVAASIPGAAALKEKDDSMQSGTIEGSGFFKAPKGSGLKGNINFTPTIGVPPRLRLIIDTTGNTDPVRDFMLFDTHKMNRNECMTNNCPGISSTLDQTKVYLGELGNECKYESLLSELCSLGYILGGMTFRPVRKEGSGEPQISFPITVVNSNLHDSQSRYSFDPADHETQTQTRNIFYVPLTDDSQMLYRATGWILKYLEPGHHFILDLSVLARGYVN